MKKIEIVLEKSMYQFRIVDHEKSLFLDQLTSEIPNLGPIPKVIHQVWIGEHSPPMEWINTFKIDFMAQHPDWTYRFWTEDEISELNLINRDLYDAELNLAGKVDILRYEILYRFGGVYVDADLRWLGNKSFDGLLERAGKVKIFVGREDHRMLGISVIGSCPGNPILGYVIRLLRSTYYDLRIKYQMAPWLSSGPVFFSEAVMDTGLMVFPIHYFYPLNWHYDQRKANIRDYSESYMIHYGYSTNNFYLMNDDEHD